MIFINRQNTEEFWRTRASKRGEETRKNRARSKARTLNKLNPLMMPGPRFDPGPHRWEVSVLNTASSPLHHHQHLNSLSYFILLFSKKDQERQTPKPKQSQWPITIKENNIIIHWMSSCGSACSERILFVHLTLFSNDIMSLRFLSNIEIDLLVVQNFI